MTEEEMVALQHEEASELATHYIRFGDGEVLLSAHVFLGNDDYTVACALNKGTVIWFHEPSRRKFETTLAQQFLSNKTLSVSNEEAEDEPFSVLEKLYERSIIANLKQHNIPCRSQVSTPYGVIDILIDTTPPTIIEVKRDASLSALRAAVGQLVFYQAAFPTAHLYIATPDPISPEYQAILALWSIRPWTST